MQFVINNWYLFLALAIVLVLLFAGPVSQYLYNVKTLSPAEAIQLVNREAGVFVDVCEPDEYKTGHIPSALNVPLGGIAERSKQLEKFKAKPVVLSCRSGNRSVKGAIQLRKLGFTSVYSLRGGLVSWQRDNLPVEKG